MYGSLHREASRRVGGSTYLPFALRMRDCASCVDCTQCLSSLPEAPIPVLGPGAETVVMSLVRRRRGCVQFAPRNPIDIPTRPHIRRGHARRIAAALLRVGRADRVRAMSLLAARNAAMLRP